MIWCRGNPSGEVKVRYKRKYFISLLTIFTKLFYLHFTNLTEKKLNYHICTTFRKTIVPTKFLHVIK